MKAKERGDATLKDAKQLAGFASHVAGLPVQKPVVIVDALDECMDVRGLIQALMVIKGFVRLFVTSRPRRVIMDDLSGLPFVSMDDTVGGLSADIELHVTRELDAQQRLQDLDTEFKTEIQSVLRRRVDGMYGLAGPGGPGPGHALGWSPSGRCQGSWRSGWRPGRT